MAEFSFYKRLQNISIAKKLYSVVGIMAVLIVVELGTLYFAVNTLSSVRAFVGAEGLWSKSQKNAIYYLRKYYQTRDAADKNEFHNHMKVPLGDHKTLVELLKEKPDLNIARQGLIEGGNHREDIDGMINLFRSFSHISYINKSINIWLEADSVIRELNPIADKLHAEIISPEPSQFKLDAIIKEIDPLNQKLTVLENDFSYTLGEGARWLENIILKLLLAIALTVEFSGLILTYFVVKGITKGLKEIVNASKRIAQKDFSVKATVFSNDEIGILATSFNDMTEELAINIEKRIQSDQDLELKTNYIHENEKRIVGIMDVLIKNTQLDFSEKLTISDRGDELDAIAVGLNTMSEELEFHLLQLKQSEQKLKDAQRLAKIGNWELDVESNKVQWSDEMYNLYGYSNERFELSFEKAMERMLPEDIERTIASMRKNREQALKLFEKHGKLDYESAPVNYSIVLPDGSRKVVEGIGKIILNKNGKVIKMAGTVQDIDHQYKAELKLHKYNTELERKNKEIEQFAYAASHDLQEPLRSISNFSKLMAEKLEKYHDQELNQYMSLVSGGATRMSNLIFDLMEYSRVGNNMIKRETDCNILVKEIIGDLAAIIEETGAEFHIGQLPVVKCYELKSVFQNLIVNAIKFKKKECCPVITISASQNKKEHIFSIKDTGIGIEPAYYDRIFIIFQRLHLRTQYSGTGIGLSLTKKIIEMHGGKIWVESTLGEGSTFYFTIPKV